METQVMGGVGGGRRERVFTRKVRSAGVRQRPHAPLHMVAHKPFLLSFTVLYVHRNLKPHAWHAQVCYGLYSPSHW